jgi:hypothetical protein
MGLDTKDNDDVIRGEGEKGRGSKKRDQTKQQSDRKNNG